MDMMSPLPIRFGRDMVGELERAESLEWLVTNGIGGYASGTVAGMRTRRYHGLLVAALAPPTERTVMVTEVHESVHTGSSAVPIHTSRWHDGSVSPRGFEHMEAFWLEGRIPVWRFAVGDHCIEKRVFMTPGKNTTVLFYRLVRGRSPLRIETKVLATYRDYHGTTHGDGWKMDVEARGGELRFIPVVGGRTLRIVGRRGGSLRQAHTWYKGFRLSRESDRGLDSVEDALHIATVSIKLAPQEESALFLTAEEGDVECDHTAALCGAAAKDNEVLARYANRQRVRASHVGARLALAADQFVVQRDVEGVRGATVVAGYPWFTDWGRDTAIALPGLLLHTGRPDSARQVLTTLARFVDRGMIPNRFPDVGNTPEYNTVDATLWFIDAVRAYVEATGDLPLARELWPALTEIASHHLAGTRHGIEVDPGDGLLRSGEPGIQLTWMDAKIGDWVVTPRMGKCVEINALWYNALVTLAGFARQLGESADDWQTEAERTRASFQRFWYEEGRYLKDVVDGPDGDDTSVRPNQIFAVSLPASPLPPEQQRAVVEACERALLTSHGLRSLASDHPAYQPSYGGAPLRRDAAYHQGTVWAWLLGPFALAHFRVFGDADTARSFLDPLIDHLSAYGVGTIAEIFDGDPPHRARGCIAQAWSVAETLRALSELARAEMPEMDGVEDAQP